MPEWLALARFTSPPPSSPVGVRGRRRTGNRYREVEIGHCPGVRPTRAVAAIGDPQPQIRLELSRVVGEVALAVADHRARPQVGRSDQFGPVPGRVQIAFYQSAAEVPDEYRIELRAQLDARSFEDGLLRLFCLESGWANNHSVTNRRCPMSVETHTIHIFIEISKTEKKRVMRLW